MDVQYWDKYYNAKPQDISQPSDFAKFAMTYMQPSKKLIDLGCGNGRDSVFFCRSGLKVTAVDSSKGAIDSFDSGLPIFAICDDFVTTKALTCIDYDYCYARWSIHAIKKVQQDELLPGIYHALNNNGLLFIEARTINDVKYGKGKSLNEHEYIFDSHYRRFLDPDAFVDQLTTVGFNILFCKEANSFSVIDGDAPMLIRIVAKKESTIQGCQ